MDERTEGLLELERRGELSPAELEGVLELRRRGEFPPPKGSPPDALGAPRTPDLDKGSQTPPDKEIVAPGGSQRVLQTSLGPWETKYGDPVAAQNAEYERRRAGGKPFVDPNTDPSSVLPKDVRYNIPKGGGLVFTPEGVKPRDNFTPGPLNYLEAGGAALAAALTGRGEGRASAVLRGEGDLYPAPDPLIESIPGMAIAAGGGPVIVGAEDVVFGAAALAKSLKGLKSAKASERIGGMVAKTTPGGIYKPPGEDFAIEVRHSLGGVQPINPDAEASAIVQEAKKGLGLKGLTMKALDAPTNLRLAIDKRLADDVTKPAFDGMWEMLPPPVQKYLAEAIKTPAEKVSPVLAQMISDADHIVKVGTVEAKAAAKRLSNALKKFGIKRGSPEDIAIYRYIGGETEPVESLVARSVVKKGEPVDLNTFLKTYEGKSQPGIMTKEGKFVTGWDHGDAYNKAQEAGLTVPTDDKWAKNSGWKVAGQIITEDDLMREGLARDFASMYEFLKRKGRLPRTPDETFKTVDVVSTRGLRWPKGVPEELKPFVDDAKKLVQDELDAGVSLGIVSSANKQEHLQGLLKRHYDDVRTHYGLRNTKNSKTIDELYMRNDSFGGIVNANQAEVEALMKKYGVDPATVPYIHEIDGQTGFKIGDTPDSERIRDMIKKDLGAAWESDLRPIPFEERVKMAEDMNPRSALARTLASMKTRNAMGHLHKKMASSFSEVPKRTPGGNPIVPEGKVLVPEDDFRWGDLRGRLMDKNVHEQIRGSVEVTDELADAFVGGANAIKSDLVGNLATGTINLTTDAVMGYMDGLSLLDPGGFPAITGAMGDFYKLTKNGEITPTLRMWMDRGGNPSGLAFDILDEDMEAVAQMANQTLTSRNRGRLAAQILVDSPNLKIPGMSPWAASKLEAAGFTPKMAASLGKGAEAAAQVGVTAGHGAAYGGLVGGPVGAAVGAGVNVATLPFRKLLAKVGRAYFSVGDPLYQYSLFRRNLERYGGDADKAWERTVKFSQVFERSAMPEGVLRWTGRLPGQSGTARALGATASFPFPGWPVNWVRLAKNFVTERPFSSALAATAGYSLTEYLRDEAVMDGRLTQEAADQLAKDEPLTALMDNGDGGNTAIPFEKHAGSPESTLDFSRQGVAVGLVPQLAVKGVAAMTDEGRVPEAFGGYKGRLDREAQAPSAAFLRFLNELSPYSGRGRAVQELEKAYREEKDWRGRPYSWVRAILATTIGLRPRPLDDQDVNIGPLLDEKKAIKAAKKIGRSGATTDEEKERAREVFEDRKGDDR